MTPRGGVPRGSVVQAKLLAAMGVLMTLIAGLSVWVVLWAIGAKAFDAIMITVLMLVLAAGAHLLVPHLPGRRRGG